MARATRAGSRPRTRRRSCTHSSSSSGAVWRRRRRPSTRDEQARVEHALEQRLDLGDVVARLLGQRLRSPTAARRASPPDRRPRCAARRSPLAFSQNDSCARRLSISDSTTCCTASRSVVRLPAGVVDGRQIWPTANRSAAASVRSHRSIANLRRSRGPRCPARGNATRTVPSRRTRRRAVRRAPTP